MPGYDSEVEGDSDRLLSTIRHDQILPEVVLVPKSFVTRWF